MRDCLATVLPAGQFRRDIVPCDAAFDHEYHQVVQVIGNLVFNLLGIRIFGSYDDLGVLLSDLF